MKQLRISAVVELPDNAFAQGVILAAVNPIATKFEEALCLAVKQDVKVDARVVNSVVRKKGTSEAEAAPEPTTPAEPTHAAHHLKVA